MFVKNVGKLSQKAPTCQYTLKFILVKNNTFAKYVERLLVLNGIYHTTRKFIEKKGHKLMVE